MKKEHAKRLVKKTKEDYNAVAKDFSRHREKPWIEGEFLVANYANYGEKILDLGCGAGQWFEFFRKKGVDYSGVDFSEKLIGIAKEKYPEGKFQVINALNLPFPDNYFDKVYAIALFHNIPSNEFRMKALREIRRVLKERGFLILTVWNLRQKKKTRRLIYRFNFFKIIGKSKLDFNDILMDWEGMPDCYFHCFTKNELRKLARKAGFGIIKDGKFLVGLERKKQPKLPNSNFYLIAEKFD